ncbi:MAG: gamma-glutamyltransferase [Pseudomonadota bacterium]
MGKRYAIAAGHRLTAETGAEVLQAGGTAMDAAMAAALMAMVAEPVLAGLLGGGFAMVRLPDGRCELLDAFVDTPRRKRPEGEVAMEEIHADFGGTLQGFRIGTGTIAAPCLAAGLAEAHARHGRMALRDLTQPAVEAARVGVPLTPYQARLAEIVRPILVATPSARALWCAADGAHLLAEGARWRNPAFADVLEEFGRAGPRFVSEGEIASALLEAARDGGHLTRADAEACQPIWRSPLVERRGAATVLLNPPPSLGGLLIAFAQALMEHGAPPVTVARAFVATAEARAEAGLDGDLDAGAAQLADSAFRVTMRQRMTTTRGHKPARRGTTHISVIDGEGLGVALTLSNGEGAGLILPGTGIMPNNMLGEDDLVPEDPLGWRTGARLASMMAPMAILWPDGRAALLGSGGSNRIRTALAQVVAQVVDAEMPLDAAIAAPRLHAEGTDPMRLDFEEAGLAEGHRAGLLAAFPEARGWAQPSMFFGGVHGVMRDARGGLSAAGDARRDGIGLAG